LIQAASIFFRAFDAPPWVMKIFIIVIIFGFPVALIFSWAFEMTPEGIKGTLMRGLRDDSCYKNLVAKLGLPTAS
jgi:hypothetical protein